MSEKTYRVWSYEVLSEYTEPNGTEKMRVRFQVSIGKVHTRKDLTITKEEFKHILSQGKFKTTGD